MISKEKEFTALITENKGIIYKICNSYCKAAKDRDDLAQEIILNLWKSFPGYKEEFKFSTWMYRIALNVAISFYRSEMKFSKHDSISEGLVVFEENPNEEIESNVRLLQGFIAELNEIDKAIILMYLDEKSHKEMASITGFSETNIATRINRIKEKLRTKFNKN